MQPSIMKLDGPHVPGAWMVAALFLRASLALIALFFILFFVRVLTAPTRASASSNTIYPSSCLGGWRAVGLASGETSLPSNASVSDYSDTNSAVLDPLIGAQLFCGGFAPEARAVAPYAVHVTFQWAFVQDSDENIATTTDTSLFGTGIIASPDATSSVTLIIPAFGDSASSSDSTTTLIPGIQITDTPPASEPHETPIEPLDTPVTAPTPDAPQSLLYRSTLGFITSVAHADPAPSGELLRISYTTDGATWMYGGSVTRDNWHDFEFAIPNPSWDELKKLQVKIEPVTTTDTRPTIYLDSIALHVDDSPSLSETIGDKLAAAGDILTDALDSVNDLADAAAAALTNATDTPPSAPSTPSVGQSAPAPTAPPAPLPKVRVLTFSLAGNSLPSREETPWQDKDIRDKIPDGATNVAPPDVHVTDNGRGLVTSGTCSDVYATVLAFRHADDYLKDPRAAYVNVAVPCYQGHFSYNLSEMPSSYPDGEYFLIVGKQGATGSWIPVSAVLPFTVTGTEIEPTH